MSITPFPSQGQYPWYAQLEQWGADTQAAAEANTITADQVHADVNAAVTAAAQARLDAQAAQVAATNAAGLVGAPAGAAVLAAVSEGGAARAELSDTFARNQRPSSVALSVALAAPYDASRNTYNVFPRHLRKARAALAAAKAGTGRFKWLCVGDSNTRGNGADKASTSYPAHAERALNADPGLVVPQSDKRWTLTNFSLDNAMRFTNRNTTAGASAVFVSDTAGTQVDYYYRGTTSAHTITIDGGTPITIAASSTSDVKKHTVTGLPNTLHTVVVTAANAWTYFIGVDVHDGTGVSVANLGISSSTTVDWTEAAANDAPQKVGVAWAPNLTTIMLGTNDAGTGVPVETTEANLLALVDLYKTTGDVVLCVPIPRQSGDLSPYIAAIYRVAEAKDVPVIDMSDRWGSYTIANELGYYSDTLHGTATSFNDLATALVDGLALSEGKPTVRHATPSFGVPDPLNAWWAGNIGGVNGAGVDAVPSSTSPLYPTTGRGILGVNAKGRWIDLGVDASTVYTGKSVVAAGAVVTLAAVMRWSAAPAVTLKVLTARTEHAALSILASGRLAGYGGGSATLPTVDVPAVDTWHRVIVVVNGASSVLVVDGVTATGSLGAVTSAQSAPRLQGTSQAGVDVAAAAIINRAVTTDELAQIDAALASMVPA